MESAALIGAFAAFGLWGSWKFWRHEDSFPRDSAELQTWRARPYVGSLPASLGFLCIAVERLTLAVSLHVRPGATHFALFVVGGVFAVGAVILLAMFVVVALTLWPPIFIPAYLRE